MGRDGGWPQLTNGLAALLLTGAGTAAGWDGSTVRPADLAHSPPVSFSAALLVLLVCGAGVWLCQRHWRRRVHALERYYRGLLDATPAALVLFDRDFQVVEWNAAAVSLYGFEAERVLGCRLPHVPADKEHELVQWVEQIRDGAGVASYRTTRRRADGRTFEVELSLQRQRGVGGAALFTEVTVETEECLAMRRHLLDIEKLASMGRMAAGTAHHLNTPLAAMLLRIQMMRERRGGAAERDDLDRLEKGLNFCRHFVQELLDFSRPGSIDKRPQEIVPTVRSLAGFLSPSLRARRARLTLALDDAVGLWVLADRSLLEALLATLLGNSLDAIDDGGTIGIECVPAGSGVDIRIRDNGHGVAKADQEHVFEPFFSTKAPGKGTGLGLATARNIVVEHGGSIDLESQPGEGTCVCVHLQCCPAPRAAAQSAREV